MTEQELEHRLNLGRGTWFLEVARVPAFHNLVRTVRIFAGTRCEIAFLSHASADAGLEFQAEFASLEDLVHMLEE